MRRYYCLMFIMSGIVIYAQEWTEQDSIWLQRVLNGTEKIQLNEETLKAIELGTFIHDPAVRKQLKTGSVELPIIITFEGIIRPESQHKQPHELPPARYQLNMLPRKDIFPDVSNAAKFNAATISELKGLDATTYKKATVNDPFTIRPGGGGGGFSVEDILRTIFWPSHRAKQRNAKNANAWKTYNESVLTDKNN